MDHQHVDDDIIDTLLLFLRTTHTHIYMCVCVCECVCSIDADTINEEKHSAPQSSGQEVRETQLTDVKEDTAQ